MIAIMKNGGLGMTAHAMNPSTTKAEARKSFEFKVGLVNSSLSRSCLRKEQRKQDKNNEQIQ